MDKLFDFDRKLIKKPKPAPMMSPGLRPLNPKLRSGPSNLWMDYPCNMGMYRPRGMPREVFRLAEGEWMFPIFFAGDLKPLEYWGKQLRSGCIRRMADTEFPDEASLEILGPSRSSFITCPEHPNMTLGIMLPVMVLHVKKMEKPFEFMISIKDDLNVTRRILFGTHESTFRSTALRSDVRIDLRPGWNELRLDLSFITRSLFDRAFKEIIRVEIYPHCRLRMIYFTTTKNGVAARRLAKRASAIGVGMNTDHRGRVCVRPWLHLPRYPEVDPGLLAIFGKQTRRSRSCSHFEMSEQERLNVVLAALDAASAAATD